MIQSFEVINAQYSSSVMPWQRARVGERVGGCDGSAVGEIDGCAEVGDIVGFGVEGDTDGAFVGAEEVGIAVGVVDDGFLVGLDVLGPFVGE